MMVVEVEILTTEPTRWKARVGDSCNRVSLRDRERASPDGGLVEDVVPSVRSFRVQQLVLMGSYGVAARTTRARQG